MTSQARAEGGQAISEMLVALLALVPLWFAIITLSGLQDIALTAQSAARYAAFDRALAPGGSRGLESRIRRFFFFGDARGPVTGVASPAAIGTAYPGLWVDPATGARWLDSPSAVAVEFRNGPLGGLAGAASDAALSAASLAAPLAPGRFELQARGPATATVRVALGSIALPLLPKPFELSAHVGVLGDAWSADDPGEVAARVRGLAALRVLAPVTAAVEPLRPLLALFEPRLAEFCPGVVAPEIVPPDRLAPRAPPRGRERLRC